MTSVDFGGSHLSHISTSKGHHFVSRSLVIHIIDIIRYRGLVTLRKQEASLKVLAFYFQLVCSSRFPIPCQDLLFRSQEAPSPKAPRLLQTHNTILILWHFLQLINLLHYLARELNNCRIALCQQNVLGT
jgi:hypothetical protein